MFYRFLKLLSNIDIPLDSGEFSAIDKKIINHIKNLPEKNKYIPGLRSWVGFKQIGIEYERAKRYRGKSKYSFFGLIKLAYSGVISFSYVPLRLAIIIGLTITLICLILIIFIFYIKFIIREDLEGWFSLMVAILFIGGIQLMGLGIIGEYVWRTLSQVRDRPKYIIEEIID